MAKETSKKTETMKSQLTKNKFEPYIDLPSPENNPQLQEKINKLMKFFDYYGIDYSKFKPEHLSFITNKKAYPNNEAGYSHIPGPHDIQKWVLAVKGIHYLQKAGKSFQQAVQQITTTGDWKKMEVYDFLNWLRFYNEGANLKYKKIANLDPRLQKTAQNWYEGNPGYILHIKKDPNKEEQDLQSVHDARKEVDDKSENKRIIEKQRQKIIGRLDSAEKLLRTPDGQIFADKELESLMEAIYNLKKKVQLVNKISTSIRLYEDMIVREANVLSRHGFIKAAEMLYSVAQTPGASADLAPDSNITKGHEDLTAQSPADPTGAGQSGVPAGLPATVPGVPSNQTTTNSDQNLDQPPLEAFEEQPAGIKEFIENMNDGNKVGDEVLEVQDTDDANDLMVSEAQILPKANIPAAALEDVPIADPDTVKPERNPPAFIPTIAPKEDAKRPDITVNEDEVPTVIEEPTIKEGPLEVSEDDIKPKSNAEVSKFERKIEDMFADFTIEDAITHLDGTVQIYRNNELSRRLAFFDMILNSLGGLSSLFPQLQEAQSKVIDSSQYVKSRLEDILSQLQGTIKAKPVDLTSAKNVHPDVADIKSKLQQDADKEKARKQSRKEQENMPKVPNNKEAPNVELNDLQAPIPMTTPQQG